MRPRHARSILAAAFLLALPAGRADEVADSVAALTGVQRSWVERAEAAAKLGTLGEKAIPPLLEALDSGVRNVQLGARLALVRIGPAGVVPALRTKLKVADKGQLAAAKALGDLGKAAAPAIPDLGTLLGHTNKVVALAARRSLILIGRDLGVNDDVIVRTDGRTTTGVFVREDGPHLSMVSIERFKDRTSVMTVSIPTNRVAEKRLAADIHRPILSARLAAYQEIQSGTSRRSLTFTGREEDREGRTVRIVETDHFLIESTAPARFVAQAAMKLDAMATGYEDYFRRPVMPGPQVRVILADSVQEYGKIQNALCGHVVLNPAFYMPEPNVIVGYSDLAQWNRAVAEINGRHNEFQSQIRTVRTKIEDAEVRLSVDVQKAKSDIEKQVRAGRGDLGVRQWAKAERERIDGLVADIRKQIEADRRTLRTYEAKTAEASQVNLQILNTVTKAMYETLAHEAFHAFFRNRIKDRRHVAVDARWLEEGLAMYFESAAFDGVDLLPGAPNRTWITFLQERQKENALFDLETVIRGGGEDFLVVKAEQSPRSRTFYAQSWYLVRYLNEHGMLTSPEAMARYVADMASSNAPATAFQRLAGVPLDAISASYGGELRADDLAWYTSMICPHTDDPARRETVLARILMKSGPTTKLRLRDGSVRQIDSNLLTLSADSF